MRVKEVRFECEKVINTIGRSFTVRTKTSWKCAGQGSCVENACQGVTINSTIKEVQDESVMGPTWTYCAAGCGFLRCGCISLKESCVFYMNTATPRLDDPDLYEFYHCTSWQPRVSAEIFTRWANGTQQRQALQLRHAVTERRIPRQTRC